VDPSDDLTPETFLSKAALYVGRVPEGGGALTVRMQDFDGTPKNITFTIPNAGVFLPICVDYVLDTETRCITHYCVLVI
jgi:hypothetical protein